MAPGHPREPCMLARLFSSTGHKFMSALTGLFLCTFLIAHISGNFLLLFNDGGAAYNAYADFMVASPIIAVASFLTYFSILYHAVIGTYLAVKNRRASLKRGYAVPTSRPWSRFMGALGFIMSLFLVIHLGHIWFPFRFGSVAEITYGALPMKNLYGLVGEILSNPLMLAFYLFSVLAVGLHLDHGIQSALRSLGLSSAQVLGKVGLVGRGFAVLMTLGFMGIAAGIYLRQI